MTCPRNHQYSLGQVIGITNVTARQAAGKMQSEKRPEMVMKSGGKLLPPPSHPFLMFALSKAERWFVATHIYFPKCLHEFLLPYFLDDCDMSHVPSMWTWSETIPDSRCPMSTPLPDIYFFKHP
jgi:hypothetical protein